MAGIVSVEHLTKRFGDFTAVDDVSFELGEGEILGFLGPNGAGKTTTIQMLLGVLSPTSGEISYYGKSLARHRSEALEQIGFSSSYTNLPWDLTVGECMKYSSYLYRIENRKTRLAEINKLFDLGELLPRQIKELSEGQKTRVNLAKAFLHLPKILLLDEPTASLDPDIAAWVRKLLRKQREDFNVSVLITSHNMAEVEEVCDRVIILDKAKIVINDTPQKVARSLRRSRVALKLHDGAGEQAIAACVRRELVHRMEGTQLSIDVPHEDISALLHDLAGSGVLYNDISIDEPSLEDYFLARANRAPEAS